MTDLKLSPEDRTCPYCRVLNPDHRPEECRLQDDLQDKVTPLRKEQFPLTDIERATMDGYDKGAAAERARIAAEFEPLLDKWCLCRCALCLKVDTTSCPTLVPLIDAIDTVLKGELQPGGDT